MNSNFLRYGLQGGFIALVAYLGHRHQVVGGGVHGAPPIDAYCPFGAVESLAGFFTAGGLVEKTASSNFWIFGAIIAIVLLSGSVFCGWLCPLGGLSEWLYKLRQKMVSKKKIEPSATLNRNLSYGRFVLLALIVYMTFSSGKLWFESYDPFKQIFHFDVETTTALLIIIAFVITSLLIERFWCRYLCPLSAIIGPLSKLSWFKIWRNKESCIHCKKCERVCPTRVAVESAGEVADDRCIQCFRCVESCPVPDTLKIKGRGSMSAASLKPVTAVFAALAVFWGIIGFAYFADYWNPQNPKMLQKIEIKSPDDIKGWMKWSEIMAAYPDAEKEVIEKFRLPENFDREKTLKVLGNENGFDVEKVKQFLEQRKK